MSTQGGLKHAATEPGQLTTKRERRPRGAAGRAAALRRAPSDSDCSGETASLSADSAERAPRPPPRVQTKSRSRRRGSEWEVLEGLKDGQRFDKRPEVFNGYLHKKRKWPLKGWHKRFFVVDGGVLVYARSAADVARGRLHGSVDVGLSVISAKQRRRRIDIDADEFIYHLRAKTPDLFRTWLGVLEVHRLYRQHLLTFGARDSAPKVHAPLEDLQPADGSSRTSQSSSDSFSTLTSEDLSSPSTIPCDLSIFTPRFSQRLTIANQINTARNDHKFGASLRTSHRSEEQFQSETSMQNINITSKSIVELCPSFNTICNEYEMLVKNLDCDKTKAIANENSDILCDNVKLHSYTPLDHRKNKLGTREVVKFYNDTKMQHMTYFCFARKKRNCSVQIKSMPSTIKNSRKSTNLVRYRNVKEEPTLKGRLSDCMLLSKYKARSTKEPVPPCITRPINAYVSCNLVHFEDKNVTSIDNTSSKCNATDEISPESKNITAKTVRDILEQINNVVSKSRIDIDKPYINKIIESLHEVKSNISKLHPFVKVALNNFVENFLNDLQNQKFIDKCTKSVDCPSLMYFTKDQNVSIIFISNTDKETQHCTIDSNIEVTHSVSSEAEVKIVKRDTPNSIITNSSKEKESRIEELERMLKSTIYFSDSMHSSPSLQKDIEITKILINDLRNLKIVTDNDFTNKTNINKERSSNEVPMIKETIKHFISDTQMPAEVAMDFLNAYLNVLVHSSSSNNTENCSSQSSGIPNTLTSDDQEDMNITLSNCKGEPKLKEAKSATCLASISNQADITKQDSQVTMKPNNVINLEDNLNVTDPGQHYFRDIFDKLTNIFSRNNEQTNFSIQSNKNNDQTCSYSQNLVEKDVDDNSVVMNLSKYNFRKLAIDPNDNKMLSVTMNLHKKNYIDSNLNSSNMNSHEDTLKDNSSISKEWLAHINNSKSINNYTNEEQHSNKVNDIIDFNITDMASKGLFRIYNESDNSFNFSYQSSSYFHVTNQTDKDSTTQNIIGHNESNKPCFIVSSLKRTPKNGKYNSKGRKESKEIVNNSSDSLSYTRNFELMSVFDKRPPKIIDDRFILLLLENLSLLSKNLPSLHKDINHVYVKLKKKYEKKANKPGLSLLGKIYNNEYLYHLKMIDKETQVDSAQSKTNVTDASVQTLSPAAKMQKKTKVIDKISSPIQLITDECKSQTDELKSSDSRKKALKATFLNEQTDSSSITFTSCTNNTDTTDETIPKHIHRSNVTQIDEVIATPNWYNMEPSSKQASIETFLRDVENCALQKYSCCKSKSNVKQSASHENRFDGKCFNAYPFMTFDDLKLTMSNNNCSSDSEGMHSLYRCKSDPSYVSGFISPSSPSMRAQQVALSNTPAGRLAAWNFEPGGPLENASRELGQAQLSVQQLQRLLDTLELQQQVHHDTDVSLDGASPNVKKDRRKFGLRKKKSSSKCASIELAPPQHLDGSTSHMALSALTAPPSPGGGASSMPNSAASLPMACAAARPQSLPGAESLTGAPASLTSLTPDHQLREDFTILAKDLLKSLKSVVATLVMERGRIRAAMDASEPGANNGAAAMLAAMRSNLNSALHQNSELRNRLSRIHDASDLAEISSLGPNSDAVSRQFQQSLSYSSSCVSASEFFDAEEHDDMKPDLIVAEQAGVIQLDGDSSSEAGSLSSEEGSASSDNSDGALLNAETATTITQNGVESGWLRRKCLPCPRPTPGGPSLWNLLYKNIGKDLSQVSMPVTINEPLNMLQRLCEELEYSELLETAAQCRSATERMSLVAAFAVSAYAASAHRAASKPFNPLLAETYECVRDDRGFRFVSEQVSHHPPISACHAESPQWCFWQEARIKTKFWGKSMEFQPAGRVHVKLHTTGDHYSWNKVTTCVHNLFGGQRWVDQYGDMHITCHGTDISCKLNFIKASSWSTSRHEVRGAITAGGTRLRVAGRWSEALYVGDPPAAKCLWRPGAMPPDHELYYGFTRFAMELNEMEPGMKDILPHTDTRFRPDQRALEEGDVEAAERHKHRVEQAQRDRRRDHPDPTPQWFRKSRESGEEMWVFGGEYWKAREAGFHDSGAPSIW